MDLPGRTSRIPVNRDEWRLRRSQARRDFVRIFLPEIREENGRVAKGVAFREWITIRQRIFVQPIPWDTQRVEIGCASRHVPEIRSRSVNYSGTQTEYRLGIGTDLIRKREPRSKRVGIVPIEAAIAGGFIDHRARQVPDERVKFLEVGALHAAVLLFM